MLNSSKKRKYSPLLLLASILIVAGCGNNNNAAPNNQTPQASNSTEQAPSEQPAEKITLKAIGHASWFKTGIDAVLKDAADKVGISLEIEKVPEGTDGDNLIKTKFATKDVPDLLFYYPDTNDNSGLGKLSDVFVPQDDQEWIANFDSSAWNYLTSDQHVYAAPYGGANIGVVLYNKQVFESLDLEIPTTMDEFWATADVIKDAGKIPVYLSGKDSWTLQLAPLQSGARPADADLLKKIEKNEAKLTDWKNKETGITFLKDIFEKGYTNKDVLSDTYDNAQQALTNGDAAMYFMATWVMNDIVTKFPDQVNDIGSFIMPFDGDASYATAFAPNAIFVPKGKNQEAAQKFINYFESVATQDVYFSNEGGIPTIKGVTKLTLTPAEIEAKAFSDAGKVFAGDPYKMKYAYDSNFPSYLQEVLVKDRRTPAQVMEGIQKDFEKNAKAKEDPNFK
ncbi:ABC transporter substrate-binding protein [Paenibacillus sinopodophylli]|uniref:ABC transporter substrate-binding protein n=1 Tax=Paenibacillus sinopodophylli TaxID=1837342 RepID=UPI00110CDB57|nr:extracellular solute-binding protein [Paenibacillus sinopodophylli]